MSQSRSSQRAWTDHDSVLWYTWDILAKLRPGESQALPLVAVPFAMQLGGHEERILASSEYALAEWTALGDGSYLHSGGFFLATGGPGLALSAAFLGAKAIGNAKRKRQAIADSQPRWVWNTRGCVHVCTGFYLQTPNGSWLPPGWSMWAAEKARPPGLLQTT